MTIPIGVKANKEAKNERRMAEAARNIERAKEAKKVQRERRDAESGGGRGREWKMTDWLDDFENDMIDPQDGEGPHRIWWEDMRPGEIRDMFKLSYERGKRAGRREVSQPVVASDEERARWEKGLTNWTPRLPCPGDCEAATKLEKAEAEVARLKRGLERIASCVIVSVSPPDCPQAAKNLLDGRAWDGGEGKGEDGR